MRNFRLRYAVLCGALLFGGAGCVHTTTSSVASYRPGAPGRIEPVQYSAAYTIQYRPADSKKPRTVAEDGKPYKVALFLGDAVGFRTKDDGTLAALLPYGKEKPLPEVPADARDVRFVTRVREPTRLSENAIDAATIATKLGVFGGIKFAEFAIQGGVFDPSSKREHQAAKARGYDDNIIGYRRWRREHPGQR